jgi:hypothetical protein
MGLPTIDIIDFGIYFPVMIIIFAMFGWIIATGIAKTQFIRLIDIIIYGPYLIYLATKQTYTFTVAEKIFLLFIGTTSISYNLRNLIGI